MVTVVYIHGANSSHRSFNYLVDRLPDHEKVFLNYTCATPLRDNIARVTNQLADIRPDSIVAHSLGGVISAFAQPAVPDSKIVSLGSPFGGSFIANFLRFQGQLYQDVCSMNPLFAELRNRTFDERFLSVIATGLETMNPKSDGVVSVASQEALRGCRREYVALNHFEVLMCDDVVRIVENHIFN